LERLSVERADALLLGCRSAQRRQLSTIQPHSAHPSQRAALSLLTSLGDTRLLLSIDPLQCAVQPSADTLLLADGILRCLRKLHVIAEVLLLTRLIRSVVRRDLTREFRNRSFDLSVGNATGCRVARLGGLGLARVLQRTVEPRVGVGLA